MPGAACQPSGQDGGEHRHGHGREEGEPGAQCGQTAVVLEGEAGGEDHAVEGEVEQQADGRRPAHRAGAQQSQGQHGGAGEAFAQHESGGRQQAQAGPGEDQGIRPAASSRLVEDGGQQGHRRDQRALRGPVEGPFRTPCRNRHMTQCQQQADASDGQVDEEHPAPAHGGHQQTAEERAGGGGDAGHRTPEAEGPGAGGGCGIGLLEEREGAGHDQRRAESFAQPGGDQEPGARGQPAAGRGDGEHHHPGAEDPAVAQPVPQRAAGEQQAGEDEGVAVRDPLDAGERGGQLPPHHRHGDVDHGHVQDDHEVARTDREKRGQGPRRTRGPILSIGLGPTGTHHGDTVFPGHAPPTA